MSVDYFFIFWCIDDCRATCWNQGWYSAGGARLTTLGQSCNAYGESPPSHRSFSYCWCKHKQYADRRLWSKNEVVL